MRRMNVTHLVVFRHTTGSKETAVAAVRVLLERAFVISLSLLHTHTHTQFKVQRHPHVPNVMMPNQRC